MKTTYHADTSLLFSSRGQKTIHNVQESFSDLYTLSPCAETALEADLEPISEKAVRVRVKNALSDWFTPSKNRPSVFSLRLNTYPLRFVNLFSAKMISSPLSLAFSYSFPLCKLSTPFSLSPISSRRRPSLHADLPAALYPPLSLAHLSSPISSPALAAVFTSPTSAAHLYTLISAASAPSPLSYASLFAPISARLSLSSVARSRVAFSPLPVHSSPPCLCSLQRLNLFAPTANRPTRSPARRSAHPARRSGPQQLVCSKPPDPRTCILVGITSPARLSVPPVVFGGEKAAVLDPASSCQRHLESLLCSIARKWRETMAACREPLGGTSCVGVLYSFALSAGRCFAALAESALSSLTFQHTEDRTAIVAISAALPSWLCVLQTRFCQRITKQVTRDAQFTSPSSLCSLLSLPSFRERSDPTMPKPRLLDLFCGAGGAAVGYARAGFEVVGVDLHPQPNYPYTFYQADALTFPLSGFAAIHASPVCKGYSLATSFHPGAREKHPLLIEPIRARLQASGLPYVIENVECAPLLNPIKLCGLSFGLRVYRHRLFESNILLLQPTHSKHRVRAAGPGAIATKDEFWSIGGHFGHKDEAQQAMGIDWMKTVDEIAQAIPPPVHRMDWSSAHIVLLLRKGE